MRLSYSAVGWRTSTILGSSVSCATGVPIDPESADWGGHTDSGAGGRLSGCSQGGGPQDRSTVPEGGGQNTGGGDAESTDGSASSDGDASTGSGGIGAAGGSGSSESAAGSASGDGDASTGSEGASATGGSGASARTDVADGSGGCGADGGYGQSEISNALCSDGIDNDCDGYVDCDDENFCCDSGVPATGVTVCHPGTCGGGTGGAGGSEGMPGAGGSDDGSCHVDINEVQVSGTGSPADEWVELHNPCSHDVDLDGWKLVYRSAQGTSDMLLHSWTDLSLLHAGGTA